MNATSADKDSFIFFQLGGTTYALRTRDVEHMEMIEQITPVPNAAPFVEGVIFSRGQVVPAVNLRQRFGFERQPHTPQSRLIIVRSEQRRVGLIVDSAREFRTISRESIQPPNEAIAGLSGRYLSGIATLEDRIVLVLDIQEVLRFSEKIDSLEPEPAPSL